jgi:hypothetical protein
MNEKFHTFSTYKTREGEEVFFPVCLIEGERPGPEICVTAGVHGCEYPGISAAIRLYQRLKPHDVSGTVRIIPIVNLAAFKERSMFVCPKDKKNLNRIMPGDSGGTFSDVLAHYLFEDFVKKSDFYIDLHGGDMVEDLIPFTLVHRGPNEKVFEKSLEMAECFGLEHIVFTSDDEAWSDKGTTYGSAAEIGIPAIIAEAGHIGLLTASDVKKHLDGLVNVLRHLGVLAGPVEKKDKYIYYE